jgi:hypothetical protein
LSVGAQQENTIQMVEAKRATLRASSGYTADDRLMVGLWLFNLWDSAGFGNMYGDEERRYMPRLLVGICIAALKERPLTITEAFVVMDAKHGKTAAKYVGLAESQGLLARVRDPEGDKRKTLLMPTEVLVRMFNDEMARIADDARELVEAFAGKGAAAAADRRKDAPGRHAARANANGPFSLRNRNGTFFRPR